MAVNLVHLDAIYSKLIRKRAISRYHGCERCKAWKRTYLELECSHFFTRAKKSTRWDIDNAVGLCLQCHQYLEHHPTEHEKWFTGQLGAMDFVYLEVKARQPTTPDAEKIKAELKSLELEVIDD